MKYEMKPLSCNPSQLKDLSERLIVSHYENNYGGAVKRLNAITAQLESLDFASAPVFVINGLKRVACGSYLLSCRFQPHSCVGYVRALLSHGLRGQRSGLCGCLMQNVNWGNVERRHQLHAGA